MLFTSFAFLLFLPAALTLVAALPPAWRWAGLLAASLVFYAWAAPIDLAYLGAVALAAYACGLGIGRFSSPAARNLLLAVGLVAVLGSLAAFKLYDFAAAEVEALLGLGPSLPRLGVTAPVGYSFYAFAAASYLVDVHARRLAPERHAGKAALYVAYFPKLLAGPIERATSFLPQLEACPRFDRALALSGLQLIVWGLFKKVVIADALAPLVDHAFGIAAYASPIELLLAVYFFAFEIYCDFSGYTDIAIGVSALFGIRLMENFRRPYLAQSTAEFWSERWHISLGRWFRDYLYIPLGGSRVGAARRYLNVMAVFAVSGLWHAGLGYGVGWTFLVWGVLNGLYQWVGLATAGLWRRLGARLPRLAAGVPLRVLRALLTFHLVTFAWIFFRAATLHDAVVILKKLGTALMSLPMLVTRYPYSTEQLVGMGFIALLLFFEILDERRSLWRRLAEAPVALRWGVYYAGIFALLLAGRWQGREFIYMQF